MRSIYEVESELDETRRKLFGAEMKLDGALKTEKQLRKIVGAVLHIEQDSSLGLEIKKYLPVPSVFSVDELAS